MTLVPSYGPRTAKIVVVGEASGADEVREGRPFVGKAGQLLRSFLFEAGIDPNEVFYTNISRERPPGNDFKRWFKDGQPNHMAVELGLLELEDELAEIKPNLILAVGNYPLWALTGKARWNKKEQTFSGIHDWRGSLVPCTLGEASGLKVLPTFHPAYILREGYSDHGIWKIDLARAKEQSQFPEIRRPEVELIIDPRGEERSKALFWLMEDMTKTLTFDIEYIGSKLLCVGMTVDRRKAVTIATTSAGDLSFVREILLSGIPLCAQNAMFDCSVLEHWYNIPCLPFLKYDTMLAAHAANIELPKGLDFLTSIYTDQPFYKDMIDWKLVREKKQPIEEVYQYNAIDTWVTHAVMEEQLADDLKDKKVRDVFDFEMSLLTPLWQVTKRGMRVDIERLKTLHMQLDLEQQEMGLDLELMAGEAINVKSTQQVSRFLFDQLGCPEGARTPGGARKVDDTTLAGIDAKCKTDEQRFAIRLVRDIRERRDLISKFCEIEFEQDGRMRGHYNPAGTDTGRLASRQYYPTGRGANQQNIPRDKRVRSIFIPDKGKVFGYADLERAESLVVAHLSGDPRMLANHAPGVDAHKRVGAHLFGMSEDEISGDRRYLAKRTAHAGNYMLGWHKLMTMVNADTVKTGISITAAEAKMLINGYKDYYHFLPQWWGEIESELRRYRKLFNLLDRQRVFFGHIDNILPNAVAFKPQSTVGDVLNVALLNVSGVICPYAQRMCQPEEIKELSFELQTNYGFEILNQVHDAIGYQYSEGYDLEVQSRLLRLMSIPIVNSRDGETFIIPIENKVGPSWGEVELIKEAA